ncbi:hypothetical protein HG530_003863 [Fusarium avenaceum]|nr:hypothetical protein HG530_003863 [Fusarium avenaceum]
MAIRGPGIANVDILDSYHSGLVHTLGSVRTLRFVDALGLAGNPDSAGSHQRDPTAAAGIDQGGTLGAADAAEACTRLVGIPLVAACTPGETAPAVGDTPGVLAVCSHRDPEVCNLDSAVDPAASRAGTVKEDYTAAGNPVLAEAEAHILPAPSGHPAKPAQADSNHRDAPPHSDLDLGQILLHLLLHRLLHKHPALALKLAMSSVDDAQDAFAQRLLDLSNEAADLVDQLGLDIVAETTVLYLVLDLALDTVSQILCTRVSSKPALDVVESDAGELFGDGGVLFAELCADLLLDLGADHAGFFFGVTSCIFHGAADNAEKTVEFEALTSASTFSIVVLEMVLLTTTASSLGYIENVAQVVACLISNIRKAPGQLCNLVRKRQRLATRAEGVDDLILQAIDGLLLKGFELGGDAGLDLRGERVDVLVHLFEEDFWNASRRHGRGLPLRLVRLVLPQINLSSRQISPEHDPLEDRAQELGLVGCYAVARLENAREGYRAVFADETSCGRARLKTPNHNITHLTEPDLRNLVKASCEVKRYAKLLLDPALVEEILDVRLRKQGEVRVRDVKRRSLHSASPVSALDINKAELRSSRTSRINRLIIPKPLWITLLRERTTRIDQSIAPRLRLFYLLNHRFVSLIVEYLKTISIVVAELRVAFCQRAAVDGGFKKTKGSEIENRGVFKGRVSVGYKGVLVLEVGEVIWAIEAAVLALC